MISCNSKHIIAPFEEEGWSVSYVGGWYGVSKCMARPWLQECWMDGRAGRCWRLRLWFVSTLAKHAVLVAKVEKTSIICVRELKAATNCTGFQSTIVSQLIAWAQHVVMKNPLIAQVYHIVFTENSIECQWVRVLFHDESKFYSTNVGLILVYGPQGEQYTSECISLYISVYMQWSCVHFWGWIWH